MTEVSVFNTFLGKFCIKGDNEVIYQASFVPESTLTISNKHHLSSIKALKAYFAGDGALIDIPFEYSGTEFQKRVLKVVSQIPHGQLLTYAQLARAVGKGANPRNVGQSNAKNMLAVIIPCHRVVGQDVKLVGYAWGLDKKRSLLEMEGAFKQGRLF